MNVALFLLSNFLGTFVWCAVLVFAGRLLGSHFPSVAQSAKARLRSNLMTPFLRFIRWRALAAVILLAGFATPHRTNAANGSVHRQKRDAPIRVTWLGHAGFEIVSAGGTRLLIDPWLEGNSAAPIAYRDSARYSAPATRPAAILVTHAHGDHDADVARLSRLSGARVVATGEQGEILP